MRRLIHISITCDVNERLNNKIKFHSNVLIYPWNVNNLTDTRFAYKLRFNWKQFNYRYFCKYPLNTHKLTERWFKIPILLIVKYTHFICNKFFKSYCLPFPNGYCGGSTFITSCYVHAYGTIYGSICVA